MSHNKIKFAFLLLLASVSSYAQLGFCNGSKGDPLFSEDFGNGTTYGPALPAGVTTYTFVTGAPNDGQYTLYYRSNQYTTWHYSLDHTPDATNGTNGKMLLMNANAVTSGDFYKKTVTGLCVNTTFEFSAWVMNVYDPNTNYCGAGQIPINVRFEIWNAAETVLLGSGNTGNIMGSTAPLWQQFALVFTTVSETSVVLKMKNNGVGGCGNDLAIDDISFSACGDLTTVSSPSVVGNTYSTCTNPASLQLNAVTASTVPYLYQWQTSPDGITWTDIAGENSATYTPSVSSLAYFRVKAAQDAANLSNPFCSTASNVFTVSVLPVPSPASSNGDKVICAGETIPSLSVNPITGTGINWYSATTGGTLLQANSATYTPTAAGIYYAETYDTSTNCIATPRTPVQLTINALPTVSINGLPLVTGNTYATCNNPASLQLNAVASGAPAYFYQWQTSPDGTTWTDVAGANNATYTPSVSSLTNIRVNVAETAASLNTSCSALSNVFTIATSVAPTSAPSNGDKVICSNQSIPSLSVNPPTGTSINWYSAATGGTLLLANSASYTPTAAGIYYAETYVSSICVATPRTPVELTIISLPTASINANPTVVGTTYSTCNNPASLQLNSVVSGASTYFYQWQTSPDGTNWTNISGATNAAYNATNVSTLTYIRVKVAQDAASLSTSCSTLSNVFTISILAAPSPASSNGDKVICSDQSIPSLSVASTAGVGVNWYSAATGGTLLLANSLSYTPTVAGTYYAEAYNVTTNCIGTRTPVKLTITSLPTVSINANPVVVGNNYSTCNNPASLLLNSVVSGASAYFYQWQASPDGTTWVNIPTATNATYHPTNIQVLTYIRVKVAQDATSLNSNFCAAISNVFTITILPAPSPAVNNGDKTICSGQAIPALSVSPVSGVSFNWYSAVTGGILLQANSASYLPTAAGTYYVEAYFTATSCVSSPRTPVKLTVNPLPTASISANPMVICANQTTTLHFTGTPNAVITYAAVGGSNQSVILNASGIADVPYQLATNTTYQLSNAALSGCSQSLSGSVAVSVNPKPNVTYTGDLTYCDGETTNLSLSSSIPGTTFSWTVSVSAVTGAIPGTGNQITQVLATQQNSGITWGSVAYTVTPINNGCPGDPIIITVKIYALPVPAITDGVICTTSTSAPSSLYYTLDTHLSQADSFQWFFGVSPIPGAFGSTYNATQIGTYSVIATNAAGCISAPVSAVVSQMPQGESLVIHQSAAFSDHPQITVTVIGGGGPFSYQLDDGPFQSSNVFYNVSEGTHTLNVIDQYCTNLTATVVIINYPHYFTPNGDGFHDTWNITGVDDAIIWIFDRYGKLIKQINTDGLGWDGTYNGHQLPSTDYWFVIDYFDNGRNKTFKAHFSLKR